MNTENTASVQEALRHAVKLLGKNGQPLEVKAGVCEKHGPYEGIVREGRAFGCPVCYIGTQRERDVREALEKNSKSGVFTFWSMGKKQNAIPKRFENASFENYVTKLPEQEDALAMVVEFAEVFAAGGSRRNMIFTGSVGVGKTHLAIALGRDLAARGFRVAYLTIFDLLRPNQERGFTGGQSVVSELGDYDLVVLDEIGAHPDFGYSSELVASSVFQLIDARYLNCRPTLLITNIEVEELGTSRAGLGDRVMDRLSDTELVTFFWDSARC